MKSIKKALIFGFLSWLIPFVAAFLFFNQKGELLINELLFKNIMIVIASYFSAFLIIKYFKTVDQNYVKEGIMLGVLWLVINLVLDMATLVPMGKTIGVYLTQIGLGYLMIPAMTILAGKILEIKNKTTN
jgi:hypothetical protein